MVSLSQVITQSAPLGEAEVRGSFMKAMEQQCSGNWIFRLHGSQSFPIACVAVYFVLFFLVRFLFDVSYTASALVTAAIFIFHVAAANFWSVEAANWYVTTTPKFFIPRKIWYAYDRIVWDDKNASWEAVELVRPRTGKLCAGVLWLVLPQPSGPPVKRALYTWMAPPD